MSSSTETSRPIPVCERLPADGEDVIVYYADGRVTIGRWLEAIEEWLSNSFTREGEHVTHWLPIPKLNG